ncbi:MAG: hypothetical protein K9K32_05765 [Halanaerobiales bacterium]|nr:hypothetical protein [Halanaerobiales bacterium]
MAVIHQKQEEVNNNTVDLLESVIRDIKSGNIDVRLSNSIYDLERNETSVEVVLDKAVAYQVKE